MNSLPGELLAQIISDCHADYIKIAQYSSVSRAWKKPVERLTFRSLTVATDELDDFIALFDGDNISRWANVAEIRVIFILHPLPNPEGCCAVVRRADRETDSHVFSISMLELFTALEGLSARQAIVRSFSLCFEKLKRRPKKEAALENPACETCWEIQGITRGKHTGRETREAQVVSGQFELLHRCHIPYVRGVTSFEYMVGYGLDCLKSDWISDVISKLPDLRMARLSTMDQYAYGRLERIERKNTFVSSIGAVSGDNLREIRISAVDLPLGNEHVPVHRIVHEGDYLLEPWSRMLVGLACYQNLRILQLYGGLVICPEFFKPLVDHPGTPFPALLEMEIHFAAETADGRWFFERDEETIDQSRHDPYWQEFWKMKADQGRLNRRAPRSGDSDHCERVYGDGPFRTGLVGRDRFRSLPSEATFLPFLIDASRAVRRLSTLKKFILRLGDWRTEPNCLNLSPIVSRVFELWFLKPGMHRSPPTDLLDLNLNNPHVPGDKAYIDRSRLYWRTGTTRIWEEVQAEWQAVAGVGANIMFMDEDQWVKNSWHNEVPPGYAFGYEDTF